MHILVDGTTITAWGEEPPTGDGIPFEVDDFPGVEEGQVLHWDGRTWWTEKDIPTPMDVIKAIFAASPALTVGIIDPLALRMIDYLPDYDPEQTYTIGMLAIHDGILKRKTLTGWRTVTG